MVSVPARAGGVGTLPGQDIMVGVKGERSFAESMRLVGKVVGGEEDVLGDGQAPEGVLVVRGGSISELTEDGSRGGNDGRDSADVQLFTFRR